MKKEGNKKEEEKKRYGKAKSIYSKVTWKQKERNTKESTFKVTDIHCKGKQSEGKAKSMNNIEKEEQM